MHDIINFVPATAGQFYGHALQVLGLTVICLAVLSLVRSSRGLSGFNNSDRDNSNLED